MHYKRLNLSLSFVAAELVKNAVKGIGQKPLTLLALFREHNEEFRKRVGIDRTKETYGCYVHSYNHLRDFVQERCGQEDRPCAASTGSSTMRSTCFCARNAACNRNRYTSTSTD